MIILPTIHYEDLTNASVEVCRTMCNALMTYQAGMALPGIMQDALAQMNFDNRLKPSFEAADTKSLLVAFDGDQPVGYVFTNTETLTPTSINARPQWAHVFSAQSQWLFPNWLQPPVKIAELNNLYVSPDYRGAHIGSHLIQHAMNWLKQESQAPFLFVYVSNGNTVAPLYESLGFQHSHEVLDGLIQAYYIDNRKNIN